MRKTTRICALVGALSLTAPAMLSLEGCGRNEKTLDMISPDYILENYQWFKKQDAAIQQVRHQIDSDEKSLANYKLEFGGIPLPNWPFDSREEFARLRSVRDGHVSQYNMLVGDFNARDSDVTRHFAKGQDPKELKPYIGMTLPTINP